MRLGRNQDLKEDTCIFHPGEVVEQKDTIKDLDILVEDSLTYGDQLAMAVTKAGHKSVWVLRTFAPEKWS